MTALQPSLENGVKIPHENIMYQKFGVSLAQNSCRILLQTEPRKPVICRRGRNEKLWRIHHNLVKPILIKYCQNFVPEWEQWIWI